MTDEDLSQYVDSIVAGVAEMEKHMANVDRAHAAATLWIHRIEDSIRKCGAFESGLEFNHIRRSLVIKSGNVSDYTLHVRASDTELFLFKVYADESKPEEQLASKPTSDAKSVDAFLRKLGNHLKRIHTGGVWA